MTRSGRCYTPEELELRRKKGKQKETPVLEDLLNRASRECMKKGGRRSPIGKIIRKSEYTVVEQLNRMPAQKSILGLLIASEPLSTAQDTE